MSTPAAAVPPAPPAPRKGFHLPVWVVAVVGGLAALLVLLLVGRAIRHHAGDRFDGRGFSGRVDGRHIEHPFLGLLFVAVLIALVVWAIVALVRHNSRSHATAVAPADGAAPGVVSAEELLALRFARGEIDEAEFRARRDALRS